MAEERKQQAQDAQRAELAEMMQLSFAEIEQLPEEKQQLVYAEMGRQLAEDKETHYLYVFDALADETGCLPAGSSSDGIHPYSKYYAQWLDYLLTHTVTEVKR